VKRRRTRCPYSPHEHASLESIFTRRMSTSDAFLLSNLLLSPGILSNHVASRRKPKNPALCINPTGQSRKTARFSAERAYLGRSLQNWRVPGEPINGNARGQSHEQNRYKLIHHRDRSNGTKEGQQLKRRLLVKEALVMRHQAAAAIEVRDGVVVSMAKRF
jgi:hypothetical protein